WPAYWWPQRQAIDRSPGALASPGTREEKVPHLLERRPPRVRAVPGDVAGPANTDILGPLVHERPTQLHHWFAIPDLVGRLFKQVAKNILAPEIPAAPDNPAREVDREIDPGLMAERIHCIGAIWHGSWTVQIHEAF